MTVISVTAAAERLGCSRRRVFQLLADGTLERAPRYGKEVRIYEASVERALAPKAPKERKSRRRRAPSAAFSVADLRADLLT